MIVLPAVALPSDAAQSLAKYQAKVSAEADYERRVALAKHQFSARNTKSNRTFQAVKAALSQMCSGLRRCCYCEDSAADEVEHIAPKDLYPDLVFEWQNYLYSCGACNVSKSNKFAVVSAADIVSVTRAPRAAVLPPTPGRHALINPRSEDPSRFFILDIIDSFYFEVMPDLSLEETARAKFTCDLLQLNARDLLVEARRVAYGSYRARLIEYFVKREAGASPNELQQLRSGLAKMPNPTVWREMQRSHAAVEELRVLFASVPEALNW